MKTHADTYGRTTGNPYVPAVSDNIKELPDQAPVVSLLDNLPGQIAEVVRHEENMIRPMTEVDQVIVNDLNARYPNFGGEPGEYPKLLSRPDVVRNKLWVMKFDGGHKCTTSVLTVGRTKDDMQRKILPTMGFNYLARRPEEVLPARFVELGMLGVAALSVMSADPVEGLA